MADLIVPGTGCVAKALEKALQLCFEMKEGQEACHRLHRYLGDVMGEIGEMQKRKQLPPSDALNKYVGIVATFLDFLESYRAKPLFSRLLMHRKMMGELEQIQKDVTAMFQMLHLASAAALMDLKQQWQADRSNYEKALVRKSNNDAEVLRELHSLRAQMEAMMTVAFELERRGKASSDKSTVLAKQLRATLIRSSSAKVRLLPPWFLPSDEVSYNPKEFARGSFGTVHHGTWGPGTRVVIKCLNIDAFQKEEHAQQRVEKEIDIWHRLNHPNVIKMYGASHVSSPPFIVCEDATNGNLCSFLADSEDNKRHVWRLLHQAALGLEYVHKNRIVHGDLKLNNILVGADGLAKLADFGLSTMRTRSMPPQQRADVTVCAGALRWRAPECLFNAPTPASDVYSLAMCIIEAFAGEPPFAGIDDNSVQKNLRHGVVPDKPSAMDDAAYALVVAMTFKDPKERMPLVHVLMNLKAFADDEKAAAHTRMVDVVAEPDVEAPVSRRASWGSCAACAASASCGSTLCADCTKSATTDSSSSEAFSDGITWVGWMMHRILSGLSWLRNLGTLDEFAEAESSAECVQQFAVMAQSSDAVPTCRRPSWTRCTVCAAALSSDTTSCYSCGTHTMPAVEDYSSIDAQIDSSNSISSLMRVIGGGRTELKERALLILAQKCIDRNLRKSLYSVGSIQVLSELARTGASYITQLCALESVSWAVEENAGLTFSEFAALREAVRDPSQEELAMLEHRLQYGTAQEKNDAMVLFGCLGTMVACRSLDQLDASIVSRFIATAQTGTAAQRLWAAYTLGNLACTDAGCAVVVSEGGIPLLVALTQSGTEQQKHRALDALANIAGNSDATRLALAREGGMELLTTLASSRSH